MTEDEYAALWDAYDKAEAEWQVRQHSRHRMSWDAEPNRPNKPMFSRRHVREAALQAFLSARARGEPDEVCRSEAVGATLALEPRWGPPDALYHFRRFVYSQVME